MGMSSFPQQPPYDPSLAEEPTDGDVLADNFIDEFV
jgi:hypothetical protein